MSASRVSGAFCQFGTRVVTMIVIGSASVKRSVSRLSGGVVSML